MYGKMTGSSRNPKATIEYLGTDSTGSNSVAHNNPKKREYLEAKKLFHDSGNPYTYRSWREARVMALDSIYMKRDLRTISNMKGHTNTDFARDIEAITSGDGRKVKSYEFILSPDPSSDKLNPHNKRDVDNFVAYCKLFQHECFDGRFAKTERYKNKRGHSEYRLKYIEPKTNASRFYHFIDVQCDSKNQAHLHAHFVEVSHDRLANGNQGMKSQYGSIQHIRKAIHRTTAIWNARHPDRQFSDTVQRKRNRRPNRGIKPLIKGLNQISKDVHVKSLKAFRDTLKNKYHIQAVRLRKTKHRVRGGWKFRYKHQPFIKASRLQRYQGLAPVFQAKEPFGKSIPKMLSKHRKQFAKLRHQAQRAKQLQHEADVRHQQAVRNEQREEAKRKYVDGSPELPTVKQVYFHGHPLIIDPIQKLADDGTLFKLQDAQEDKIEASHDRWVRSNPRRLARYYEHDDPSNQVVMMMKHLSSNPVRKSVPKVSSCYQKQCFPTYSVQDAQTGRREFRLLDGKLGYTHSDKGWFSRVFGGFVKDWNAFRDKAGRKLVHSSIRRHWKRLTTSVKGYIRKHVQPPLLEQLYRIYHRNNSQAVSEIITAAMSYNETPGMYRKVLSFNADEAPKCYKLLNHDKVRRKLKKFYSRYNIFIWLNEHDLVDNPDVIYRKRILKRQRHERKILKVYGNNEVIRLMYRYCKITNTSNKFLEKYIHTANLSQTYLKRKYPNVVKRFNMDKFTEGKPKWQKECHKMMKTIQQDNQRKRDREQAAYERARTARYNHMMRLRRINARRRNQQQGPTLG